MQTENGHQIRRVNGCSLLDEPHVHVDGRCDERISLDMEVENAKSEHSDMHHYEETVEFSA